MFIFCSVNKVLLYCCVVSCTCDSTKIFIEPKTNRLFTVKKTLHISDSVYITIQTGISATLNPNADFIFVTSILVTPHVEQAKSVNAESRKMSAISRPTRGSYINDSAALNRIENVPSPSQCGPVLGVILY